ncbi:Ig-like domain-containing protein [Clostridium tagluense]|uniref:Ig-like domain-containing protein n=1 Tax=Clostridium tagluense TaxID=360422 RepID=UPI001C0C8F21|nr:Ig-like domain-containing protein [Clostridium tagluense]MBU3130187.1 Ig-like domain-containing protein [Clostridium tagluense]
MKLKKVAIIFICLLVFGAFNSNVYAAAKKTSPQIKSIANLEVTLTQTDSFNLPTALKVKMSNGSNKSVPVTWDKKVNYNKIGIQRFSGTVNGYKNKVLLTLSIKDEANLDKIKEMSLYEFELKDENDELYNVYVYQVNSKNQIASFEGGTVWAGASEGDVLYSGNVKIAFSKVDSKDAKVIQPSSKYVDGTYPQTINASRELIKKIESQYEGEPDLLLIGDILCSNASGINIYYINNGILKQIQGELSTCNAYDLFFRQVDTNIFERSAYDNTECYFYVMKSEFDFNTGAIKDISHDKMTIEEYREYVKNINTKEIN